MKRIDLTGQTFGRLTVLEISDKIDATRCRMWMCQCECGNITYASSNKLLTGRKKSCGCAYRYASKTKRQEHEPKIDCVSYRSDYLHGCAALSEKLCVTRGSCSFYKPKDEGR
ncbi:MAG: hypothetical protein ACI4IW_07860 [Oscillospiraceae bacterium]